VRRNARDSVNAVAVYESHNGGRRWYLVLDTPALGDVADPSTAFGPDGTAYALAAVFDMRQRFYSLLYHSLDGGTTWGHPLRIDRLDTQFTASSNGSQSKGIYIDGIASLGHPPIYGAVLLRSDNHVATASYLFKVAPRTGMGLQSTAPPVVLSDGTIIVPFAEWGSRARLTADAEHPVLGSFSAAVSRDGGKTFDLRSVGDWPFFETARTEMVGAFAADTTRGVFEDRIYAAWSGFSAGRWQIFVSHSADRGRTWSRAFTVNDDVKRFSGNGPDDFKPALAVNRDGVVALMWYDRRDNADDIGWWPRMALTRRR